MINLIGAYIVGVVAIALLRHRPPLARWDAALAQSAPWGHLLLLALLSWLTALVLYPEIDQLFFGAFIPGLVFTGANTWIHEAGHGFLFWAPLMVMIAGGTALQLGVPLGVTVLCLLKRYYQLLPIAAFWFFGNLPSVGVYISDAAAQKLPMLGGSDGIHDWHAMLEALGLLEADQVIGSTVWYTGVVGMTLSAVWLAASGFYQKPPSTAGIK